MGRSAVRFRPLATRPLPADFVTSRRLLFFNRYFFPDHSATSQLLSDLAFHLAATGHRVQVFTSRQRYDDPRALLPTTETVGGVAIRRLATTRLGRSTLIGRTGEYLSFYRSVARAALTEARPGDILVVKTDPPMLNVPLWRAARRRGLLLVNWLQDLYPEIAVEVGLPFVRGPVARHLTDLRDAALQSAAGNVVVGERMAARVRARGVAADRVHLIPNWCDDDAIRPVPHADNPLRAEWGLADRFVVAYSGNLGRGHEFDTVLDAAEELRDLRRCLFLFIGGGSRLDKLIRRVRRRRLNHLFRFLPYQNRERLALSLGVADVHWLSLKPELEGLLVPSKFYGIAAAGRPIVAITAPDGEIARLVAQHRCGIVVAPGDGPGLAAALRGLAAAPHNLAEMGRQARAMLESEFTRHQAFARWREVLTAIALHP
jgi:glycosyltransferase involved in cell wall biosynthesis